MGHVGSYLWKIRRHLGSQLVLMPGAQVLVLNTAGLALFQRRADTGLWELPSGGCEPGQSFRTAAAAELAEETGIVVAPEDLVPFGSLSDGAIHTLAYPNGDRVQAFAMCFVFSGWEGTVLPRKRRSATGASSPWTTRRHRRIPPLWRSCGSTHGSSRQVPSRPTERRVHCPCGRRTLLDG